MFDVILVMKRDTFQETIPSRKRRRRRNFIITRRTLKKRRPRDILPNLDFILVMKREVLQEIVPTERRDIMLISLKKMNQQTKGSEERRMIQRESMC